MSWHKYLADSGGCNYHRCGDRDEITGKYKYTVNLCVYRARILFGALLHLGLLTIAGLLLAGITVSICFVIFPGFMWLLISHTGIFFGLLFGGAILIGHILHEPVLKQKKEHTESGMLVQMFDSWKEKYCVMIEVKD